MPTVVFLVSSSLVMLQALHRVMEEKTSMQFYPSSCSENIGTLLVAVHPLYMVSLAPLM